MTTTMTTPMRTLRKWIPLAVSTAVLFVGATPAFAHVSISSPSAVGGQPATMTLTVPNERSDAATVQIDLRYPEGQPLTGAVAAATPGWNATVDAAGIVWNGGPLTGESDVALAFTATLPNVDRLEFPVLQTYDDGDIVRWIQSAPEGSPEPDFPAPVLAVSAPPAPAPVPPTEPPVPSTTVPADDHTVPDEPVEPDDEAATAASSEDDDDAAPVIITMVAVVAALAAGGGALIYRRRRRTPA
jgi:MYXO-CTERM domain-containing protein